MWKLEGALVGMHLLQTTFHPCCPLEGSPSSRPKNSCSVHLFCQNGFLCVGLRPVLTDGSHSFILRLMQFFSTTSYSTGCSHGCCPETAHAKKSWFTDRTKVKSSRSEILTPPLFIIYMRYHGHAKMLWDIPLHKAYIIKTERCRN